MRWRQAHDGRVTTSINDLQVAFDESGDGAPVVLVHGLAESRQSWANQQRELSAFHTYAYDLRGHGETSLGRPEASLEQLGRDLIGFLEQVTGPASVVGFSLGGTIALWAAAERPDLMQRVVVLGTSSVVGRAAVDFYAGRIELAADTASDEFREALRSDTAAGLAVAHDQVDEVTASRLAAIGDGHGYVNAARAMAALNQSPLTPKLAEVAVHVDVVGAASDSFCPPKASHIILDALPDAEYHEIDAAGHLMSLDNPAAVTDVLRRTLQPHT